MPRHAIAAAVLLCCPILVPFPAEGAAINAFFPTNLVSDLSGVAAHQDPHLVNPWGITFSGTSPIWISDNGTGLSTVYNGAGQSFPTANPIVVTVPPPAGGTPPSAPTGVVFNGGSSFGASRFIFATEDGTIAGWTGGSSATLRVDNSAAGAVYKGLATGNNGSTLLYAANFNAGTIDVFDSTFAHTSVPGGFTDSTIPAGFAPFNIENIGGNLYVTYAMQDAMKHDDVAGPGNGYVDVFDTNGNLIKRLVSKGALNSPWGMALAPSTFGPFGNDLLIGNFGSGMINAYDPASGAFLGTLQNSSGSAFVEPGLWGLAFGNGARGTSKDSLYFTAGIPGPDSLEDHGLFGSVNPVPEPADAWLILAGLAVCWSMRRKFA
ncbi:MAG: TIGR03118 family protein [Bryobacteraceae bacterium]